MNADTPFRLEQCLIKPREFSIEFTDGEVKLLQPKFIDVLAYLAIQFPRLVDRQELIDTIWDGNQFVGEKALTNAVWNLRNVLKRTNTAYIETVRKTGYRLLVEPEYLEQEVANASANPSTVGQLTTRLKDSSYVGIGTVVAITAVIAVTIMVLVFWLVLPQGNSGDSLVERGHIVNVTDDPGREVYPVVSPDNQFVIYAWRRIGRQPNLYLKSLIDASIPVKQLTFTDDYEGRVVFHPGGEQIYFMRKHWDSSVCQIIELNLVTTVQKVIAKCTGELSFTMALSPDGNLLAFNHLNQRTSRRSIHLIDLQSGLPAVELYDCEDSCVYQDLDADFSPDSKQLVISRTLNRSVNESVFLFDLHSKQLVPLGASAGEIKGLAWHPSGDRIVYSAQVAGQRNGYVITLADKKTSKLNIPGFSYPRFVPGSTDLVFHHWQVSTHLSSLTLTDTMAAAPFPLMQSEYSYGNPHYSEQAGKIAFISNESGFEEVWIANIDGSERQKLTSLESHLTFPRWSHNGQYIAFLGPKAADASNALHIFNVKSRVGKKLDSRFDRHYRPSWLIDDSALIAGASINHKQSLYAFGINNQSPRLLLDQPATYAEQGQNGDIWYTPGQNKGLWVFSPAFEPKDSSDQKIKPRQVLGKDLFRVAYNWELTTDGIYFKHDYSEFYQINYFNISTGAISAVVKLPTGTLARTSSMTFIPSQNKIVFTRMEFPKVDVKRLQHVLLQ